MPRRFMFARHLFVTTLCACFLSACDDDGDADSLDESSSEVEEHSDAERADKSDTAEKRSEADAGSSAPSADAGSADEKAAAGGKSEASVPPADKDAEKKPADKPKTEPKTEPKKDEQKPAADKGDESLKVSLRFHAKVGKSDFACSHKYAGQGTSGTTVTPLDLRLFVHDVALLQADGSKVPLALIAREPWQSDSLALLDFEDKTGRCSDGTAETNTAITGTAPKGTYTGVSFVVGVPEELNHKDPATLAAPLKAAGDLSPTGAEGFRFARAGLVQLNAAADASGSGLFDLGSTQCSGSVPDGDVKCEKANRNLIKLETFDLEKNSIVIDVASIFAQVDLTQPQVCHGVEKSCAPMFSAFGVSFATGQAEAEQRVFSVE